MATMIPFSLVIASLWLTWAAGLGLSPGGPMQDRQFREREVLDPETGEWVPTTEPVPAGPEGPLDEARGLLARGEPRDARGLLKDWLKENPDDERFYEGTYLMGVCYFQEREFWKAAERFETVAENSAGELFEDANEGCVDVARAFLSGEKRIVWRIFRFPAYDEGVELLDKVWERMPGTRLGEVALKLKADYYFARGEMGLAEDEYANLVQQFPSGRYVQLAMLRGAVAAEAAYPGVGFDDLPLVEATERYGQVQRQFPGYAEQQDVAQRVEGIRQLRAQSDFEIARWYERTRQGAAAAYYYQLVLREWPDTLFAAEARTRLQALGVPVAEPESREAEGRP